jgi:hypothetical protein
VANKIAVVYQHVKINNKWTFKKAPAVRRRFLSDGGYSISWYEGTRKRMERAGPDPRSLEEDRRNLPPTPFDKGSHQSCDWDPRCPNRLFDPCHWLYDNSKNKSNSITTLFSPDVGRRVGPYLKKKWFKPAPQQLQMLTSNVLIWLKTKTQLSFELVVLGAWMISSLMDVVRRRSEPIGDKTLFLARFLIARNVLLAQKNR